MINKVKKVLKSYAFVIGGIFIMVGTWQVFENWGTGDAAIGVIIGLSGATIATYHEKDD